MHRGSYPAVAGVLLMLWALKAPLELHGQEAGKAAATDFSAVIEEAARLRRLHSLLISRHGELILERYFHGASAARLANIKSVSKSVISALVGIAIKRELIKSVDTPIAQFFPERLGEDADPAKRSITVEHLLTMRSGLEPTSGRGYGAWVQSSNWVRYVLSRPLVSQPGEMMDYSTGNSHLLSAILTKVSGKSTWQFARDVLARPLGIRLQRWQQDPQGIYFGGNNMEMTPRQMLAFGELYLNWGRANGSQVVPEDWIRVSFIPRARSYWSNELYGYGWWIGETNGYRAYFAWGYGGQLIYVIPDLRLVVVTTSSATTGDTRRSHRRAVFGLVEELVAEAARASAPREARFGAGGGRLLLGHRPPVDLDPVEPGTSLTPAAAHQVCKADLGHATQVRVLDPVALDDLLDIERPPAHAGDHEFADSPVHRRPIELIANQPRAIGQLQDDAEHPESSLLRPPHDLGLPGEVNQLRLVPQTNGPVACSLPRPNVIGVIGGPVVVTLLDPVLAGAVKSQHQVFVRHMLLRDRQGEGGFLEVFAEEHPRPLLGRQPTAAKQQNHHHCFR